MSTKYRKTMEVLLMVAFICGITTTAWNPPPPAVAPLPGEVYSVYLRSTLYGIEQAILGKPGTAILAKDGAFLFIWRIEDGFAFAGIRAKAYIDDLKEVMNGNYVNVKTIRDLTIYLGMNGWLNIAKDEVPAYLRKAVAKAIAGAGWFKNMMNTMPTFIILFPGAIFPEGVMPVKG